MLDNIAVVNRPQFHVGNPLQVSQPCSSPVESVTSDWLAPESRCGAAMTCVSFPINAESTTTNARNGVLRLSFPWYWDYKQVRLRARPPITHWGLFSATDGDPAAPPCATSAGAPWPPPSASRSTTSLCLLISPLYRCHIDSIDHIVTAYSHYLRKKIKRSAQTAPWQSGSQNACSDCGSLM